MLEKSPGKSTLYVRQLGTHHFAYLRAVAEGVDVQVAAKMYLGIEHGHETTSAHRQVVDHLRGVARRRGDKDWRLVGLVIRADMSSKGSPSLDEWAADRGLDDGWSEAELQEMYLEANPVDRKAERNARLRGRQLDLLKSLQTYAAQAPKPTDPVAGWFDAETSERLKRIGILMLGELQTLVARGGRWWAPVPAIGPLKAKRIESFLNAICVGPPLLASLPPSRIARATTSLTVAPADFVAPPSPILSSQATQTHVVTLDGSSGANRAVATPAGTSAKNDREAIEAWIAVKAGSEETAKSYRREAERLLLWCIAERRKPLSSMGMDDCLAYMAFLEHIPAEWVSRRHAKRLAEGWKPFSGQLSVASRRQAIVVVSGLFEWLVSASYHVANPWKLVNKKTGDDPGKHLLDSRAFTQETWHTLRNVVVAQPPSPARDRTLFLMDFGEATGIRSAEFLSTTMGAFRPVRARWALQVHGKGSKNRVIAVPTQAVLALEAYLVSRGLPPLGKCDPQAPLLGSVRDSSDGIGYQALYKSTKAWFKRAIRLSDLPVAEQMVALRASTHWLRHTCGTRALERGVKIEQLQRQLGHADIRTTMRYAKTQLEELLEGMEDGFGG